MGSFARRVLSWSLLASMLAACGGPKPVRDIHRDPLQVLRKERIAVVSLPHDERVRASLEASMAGRMRARGIDAKERSVLLPESGGLSTEDLHKALAKAGITYVFEIDYDPAEAGQDGSPKSFHSYMVPLGRKKSSANQEAAVLDTAIILLMNEPGR